MIMKLLSFFEKPLVLREYRMTVQWIKDLKKEHIPIVQSKIENYGKGPEIRGKEFYEELLKYYNEVLVEKESRLEDLKVKMRKYNMPLE